MGGVSSEWGIKVQGEGLGFRVWGYVRVYGAGPGVWDLGYHFQRLGFAFLLLFMFSTVWLRAEFVVAGLYSLQNLGTGASPRYCAGGNDLVE